MVSLAFDVGVWFAAFGAAAADIRSMGDLLLVLLAFDMVLLMA